MSEPEPTPRLILQRIRNRVIETHEIFASLELQRNYALVAPVYVPYELINQWEDWVQSARPIHFSDPVFSSIERDAVERFHAAWDKTVAALPDNYPPLEEVLNAAYWARLQDSAQEALTVFRIRGKLPDDVEAV